MARAGAMKNLSAQHNSASTGVEQKISLVVDHLITALAGDASSPVRRALVLVDIHMHPGTTHSDILDRTDGIHKSAVTRDIDWLHDHGCIERDQSLLDAREVSLSTAGFSRKNIDLAMTYLPGGPENLKAFLEKFITLFQGQKPSLLQAKILATINERSEMSRQEMLDSLGVPATTAARALAALVESGLILKDDDKDDGDKV